MHCVKARRMHILCVLAGIMIPSSSSAFRVGGNRLQLLLMPETGTLTRVSSRNNGNILSIRGGSILKGNEIYVKKVLRPRPKFLNVFVILRYLSSVSVVYSFWLCIKSTGEPYRQAMKELGFHPTSLSSSFTSLDEIFARQIAMSRGDIIPSPFLPGWQPLTLSVISAFLFLATVLLPKWFIELDVLSRFSTVRSFPFISSNDIRSKIHEELSSVFCNSSVLISLPENERIQSNQHVSIKKLCRIEERCTSINEGSVNKSLYLNPYDHYVDLNQRRMYIDLETGSCLDGGPICFSDIDNSFQVQELVSNQFITGLCTQEKLQAARDRYEAYSHVAIEQYRLWDSLIDRISSPLAVMKFVAHFTTLLEEPFWRFMFETMQTCYSHIRAARYSISSSLDLVKEVQNGELSRASIRVCALRSRHIYKSKSQTIKKAQKKYKWTKLSASQLLPGDVFHFLNSTENESSNDSDSHFIIPVDALLLEGSCICSEAALTGESVPQVKTPIESCNDRFDMFGIHRSSVIFAGTKLLRCENKKPVKFLALRCGTYSCQGELLRYLVKAKSGKVSNEVQEADTLHLMFFMSLFGVASCVTLFVGDNTRHASSFRNIIQCTRILLAAVPSSLPVIVSSLISASSKKLRTDSDTVCSKPSAMLDSSQISMAIFDKTGTLTADTQQLCKTISYKIQEHPLVDIVLAGSHSLVSISSSTNSTRLIGDPLDLACLQFTGATYNDESKSIDLTKSIVKNVKETKERLGQNCIRQESPTKLWIVKAFPFDPTSRKSSTLVLARYRDNSVQLLRMIKGAPDAMKDSFKESLEEYKFSEWYDDTCLLHTNKGKRLIAMGSNAINLDYFLGADDLRRELKSEKHILKLVKKLKKKTRSLSRSFVEQNGDPLDFVGFACFDAFMRKSSARVIQQLKLGAVRVCMLTGDSVDAGVSAAMDVGIITKRQKQKGVIELDVRKDELIYSVRGLTNLSDSKGSKVLTNKKFLKYLKRSCAFAATGRAIEKIIHDADIECFNQRMNKHLRDNLHEICVIGRATPQLKRRYVAHVKQKCGQNVLMCGDGVNDVAALKAADVGVALLNGYGIEDLESNNDYDWEDERRKSQIKAQQNTAESKTLNIPQYRIKTRVMTVIDRVEAKKTLSHAITFSDVQSLFGTWWLAVKDEITRSREIRKGSGRAAQLIQEDEKLRRSLVKRLKENEGETDLSGVQCESLDEKSKTIKAGEACLAASFTVLRPSIDGVEAILRNSVAVAANVLSTREMIVLESVLACYSLSALYKEHVRYGKFMWPSASFLISAVYGASSVASNTPLPKLTKVRPPTAVLCSQIAPSLVLQSIVHLSTMALSVKAAKHYSESQRTGFNILRVRMNEFQSQTSSTSNMGRPPFKPNLITNVVFLLSAFQSSIIVLVNHQGRPFYGSVLESRLLSSSLAALIAFCVACTSEILPQINMLLQLAPFPRHLKLIMLSLFAIDGLGAFIVKKCCTYIWNHELWINEKREEQGVKSKVVTAADEEEFHLKEKARENTKYLLIYVGIIVYCSIYAFIG